MNVEETKLIEQSQLGNIESFEKLIIRYQDQAYRTAYRILGNPEDAKDATQESFIKIYRSLKGFKLQSNFSTWMYRIIHNTCLDMIRKRKRRQEIPIEIKEHQNKDDYKIPLEDPKDGPEALLDYHQLKEQVESEILKLPVEYRGVIILRDIEGLSYQEIAEALEISEGTVKSRLNRGRTQLRQHLAELLEDG